MAFNIAQAWKAFTTDKPKSRSGYGITSMTIPPGWNTQQYLQAYGQVGWLFGAVSLIATSVAEVNWELYKGDIIQKDNHPLLALLNKPNPFQTRYEMFLMLQTYLCLVGKAFIVMNYNGRLPVEMWLAPPQFMTIIPDKQKYIWGYVYQNGAERTVFAPDEVIYINLPNPLNPMDGMGAVQSIATDLQNEIYATRYTNKLFYNDAVPGFAIEIPEMYTKEQRDEYQAEWDKRHRGLSNARKTAFLWGGAKINSISMTNKDMDFAELRSKDKEVILGTLHVPARLLGLTDTGGTRAAIEADDYVFAKRVIKPDCQLIKEAINEQLCPIFGSDLNFDYDNPVPANKEADDNSTRASFATGLITFEEARLKLGYDAEPEKGETLYFPFTLTPQVVGAKPIPQITDGKTKGYTPDQLEARWRAYIIKTEALEKPFIRALRDIWGEQEKLVVTALERNQSADALFADEPSNKYFSEHIAPAITLSVQEGWNDALSELQPKKQFNVLNRYALAWIATRSLSLATMVNGTTKDQLRQILADGFANGLSIPDITRSIREFYKDGYENRAPMVARTEVITASNKGANELYKEEGVQKVEWYTALDERVCLECEPLHEKVFPIDDGPRPALHPSCRCVITAYLD